MEATIVTAFDHANTTPSTMPRISPMAQPVRQWVVALKADRFSEVAPWCVWFG
jgi:hypothetical protein